MSTRIPHRDFRCLFIIYAVCLSFFSAGQTGSLSGRVFDARTIEPLPFANVFINNTTLGAAADAEGRYQLREVPTGWHEVIFSFVGYQPYQTRIQIKENENLELNVRLVPDEKQLDVVEVQGSRDKEWEKQFVTFQKIFFGDNPYSLQCKIENPWVLDFSEARSGGEEMFLAKASQPLVINNLALGYKLIFFLKDFKAGAQSYVILGNMRFEEMNTNDSKLAERWTANRRAAYLGSERHLYKAILDGQVKEQGFQLYTDKPGFENASTRTTLFSQELGKSLESYPLDKIVTAGKREGEYRIALKGRVEVHNLNALAVTKVYRDVPFPVAWIESRTGFVDVNKFGVPLNTLDVFTSGYMNSARVAEMLPFDYQVDKSVAVMRGEVSASLEALKIKRMRERVYLHTDKPYYYPGEVIWFKGYVRYDFPELIDSLSRVVYVELLGPDKKILEVRTLPVDSGRLAGDIALKELVNPGNYYLRAYTRWMLNYPTEDIFIKPLPVLNLNDKVIEEKALARAKPPFGVHVQIQTDTTHYRPRELVRLGVSVVDEQGLPLAADMSVSITDLKQVKSISTAEDICLWANRSDSISILPGLKKKFEHPVEYGISFAGQFLNDKSKPERANVNVVQGRFLGMVSLDTDADGKFWLNGFQFRDSMSFAFDVKNEKGKSYGKVILLPRVKAPTDFPSHELKMGIEKTNDLQRYKIGYLLPKDATLLDEVIVNATKPEEGRTKQSITYGTPDHVVKGADLQIASAGNIVPALQGRIPGLQVTPFWDENGFQRYKIRIRGGLSTFGYGGTTEPLLLIDGIPLADGGFIADQLAALNPSAIERIEVITKANPMFGVRGTNGVIAVYTTNSGTSATQQQAAVSKKVQSILVPGYSVPLKFVTPAYATSSDQSQPDYRSTIYWNPWVNTSQNKPTASCEFFTADLPTTYRIVIEGVDSSGRVFHEEKFIEILSR